LGLRELRLALAAPATRGGFVSRRTSVNGLSTHYRESMTVGGSVPLWTKAQSATSRAAPVQAVVLLHGLAVSHRYLMPTARALAVRRRVLVPDLPGFGLSEHPSMIYGITQHAEHIVRWAEVLELTRVCLLGHSFGAQVAAAVAVRRPDLIRALVLAGPIADSAARSSRGQLSRFLRDVTREDVKQAVILARDVYDAGPARVFGTLDYSVRSAIEDDLARTVAPVLLLRGTRDPIAPAQWLVQLARRCGGPAEVGAIRGAAHNVATTAGPAVAERILTFLAGLETRGSAGVSSPPVG
jgi:pimeloyl-ACP methyl ester carboxylesterase